MRAVRAVRVLGAGLGFPVGKPSVFTPNLRFKTLGSQPWIAEEEMIHLDHETNSGMLCYSSLNYLKYLDRSLGLQRM